MNGEQALILAILALTALLFIHGRWRHDTVALAALLACVFGGLTPPGEAFAGFGHPAVITVAGVLVLSRGLQVSGAVDLLARLVLPQRAGFGLAVAALSGLGALLSAFMNNVGAMALLMPLALQAAARHKQPPGRALMPLAFATILGGMTTLIGTPPNLIVAAFRAETGAAGFAMFDFSRVGGPVALAGLAFVLLAGRRLVPARERRDAAGFDMAAYLTEVRVEPGGGADGRTVREIEPELDAADAQVIALIRRRVRIAAPDRRRKLRAGDILVIEAEPEPLAALLTGLGLKLVEEVPPAAAGRPDEGTGKAAAEKEKPGEPPAWDDARSTLGELVVSPGSALIGQSASDILLRDRYGLNLLALSRQGRRSIRRLRSTPLKAGDVVLIQGMPESIAAFGAEFAAMPLAPRSLRIPSRGRALAASVIMALAVAVAAFGLLPAAVAFAAGALLFVFSGIVPARRVYEAVDWPVVVLLGALIPVATAVAETGAADLLAGFLLTAVARGNPLVALALIMAVTMVLSDFMNNAATAAVMCPLALGLAAGLGVNPEPFLMAVAIGASCAFLTPIGHQNNTLILGPGGFRFGDYWPLGLPLEVVVLAVAVPLLPRAWPF